MRLYAENPALRLRQIAADVGLLVWIVGWVLAARAVHNAVLLLAGPGQAVEDLGRSVGGSMDSAAGVAEDVPLVGDELSAPFGALAKASGSARGAGQSAQDAVDTLATSRRSRWSCCRSAGYCCAGCRGGAAGCARPPQRSACSTGTEAGASTGHVGALGRSPDLELLAARAMATAPLPGLAAACPPAPGAAWRAGSPRGRSRPAALELAPSWPAPARHAPASGHV